MSDIRTTQRVPLACVNCATRRIKCNKKVPCDQCIKRKIDDLCGRETVIVKGQLRNEPWEFRIERLETENSKLKNEVEALKLELSQLRQKKDTKTTFDLFFTAVKYALRGYDRVEENDLEMPPEKAQQRNTVMIALCNPRGVPCVFMCILFVAFVCLWCGTVAYREQEIISEADLVTLTEMKISETSE